MMKKNETDKNPLYPDPRPENGRAGDQNNQPTGGLPHADDEITGPAREKKRRRLKYARCALDLLSALSGAFILSVYLPYLVFHAPKGHVTDVIAALLMIAGVLLPFFLRRLFKKLFKKAYTPLKAVWCFFMCFYMVTFSVFALAVTGHDDVPPKDEGKTTVVVVFGCQVHRDRLSLELESRLRTALEVLRDYPDALCVVSGGKGEDEPTSEAFAMKDYLVRVGGFPSDRIFEEDRSTDTSENVRFTLGLLREKGLDPASCSFICVSSEFHTPRIHRLFSIYGITDAATVSAPTPLLFNRFVYTVREYMSFVHLILFGA